MTKQLIYVGDPMCSWCWGFAPVMTRVADRFAATLPIRLVLGGLRPGTTKPLDDDGRQTIRDHWRHVHEASGQPFDFGFFDRAGFVYDTEPPSRAMVAVRGRRPDLALTYLERVHRAFYAEGRDVTDRAVLVDLAAGHGLDRATFESDYDDEATLAVTRNDFAIARQAGITGFPTLLAGDDAQGYGIVTHGWQPWDAIEPRLVAAEPGPAPAT